MIVLNFLECFFLVEWCNLNRMVWFAKNSCIFPPQKCLSKKVYLLTSNTRQQKEEVEEEVEAEEAEEVEE